MSAEGKRKRIDYTVWTDGSCEFHGHTDALGNTPPLHLDESLADLQAVEDGLRKLAARIAARRQVLTTEPIHRPTSSWSGRC